MKTFVAIITFGLISFVSSGMAQITLTGATTYTEDFDGLGQLTQAWIDNSTLPGWVNVQNQAGTGHTGTLTAAAGTQFGNIGNFGTNSDRALGWVPNNNDTTDNPPILRISQYVYFQNNSGGDLTITDLTLDYEQWRFTNQTTSGIFHFVYGTAANIGILDSAFFGGNANSPWVDDNQFDFITFNASSPGYTGPGAVDGNVANFSQRGVTGTVGGGSGITLSDGEVFAMGWYTGNSQNHAFAVDNISLTVIPEPSSTALLLAGAAALFVLRRNLKK